MIFIITTVIILLVITFIAYIYVKKNKIRNNKTSHNKNSFNYYREPAICILNKESIEDSGNIKVLNIDKDITHIEDKCFINCSNLSTFKVDETSRSFCSKLGVLFTKDMKKIICYPSLKQTSTYVIPQGVEEIDAHAFFNNKFLKYIVIPTSLKSISENSFINCKFINQIVIPENVIDIHPRAFNLCPRLTIRGYKGSFAEYFSKEYYIPFEYLNSQQ